MSKNDTVTHLSMKDNIGTSKFLSGTLDISEIGLNRHNNGHVILVMFLEVTQDIAKF